MNSSKAKSKGLGRGLSALMADVEPKKFETQTQDSYPEGSETVPIEKIYPNPDQPRKLFSNEKLEELAASIAEKGIIQPLIVRDRPNKKDEYEIVAGERRWRAAQIAKIHQVPVIKRQFSDSEVLEVAVIENIQRADLDPVEEAKAYGQLMERFGHTQEKLSKILGKSRSYIANSLRLMNLPNAVLDLIQKGKLSAGHARALIPCNNAEELAMIIVRKGFSVRETENLVKKLGSEENENVPKKNYKPGNVAKDADTKALEGDLSAALGMKIKIDHQSEKEVGQVTIFYRDLDQLDNLCRILGSNT